MRTYSSRTAAAALVVALGAGAAGCGQIGVLKARMAFKDANKLYQAQEYFPAAERYEETLMECAASAGTAECTDPNLTAAYFFLGNSYENLFRPARRGEAQNDEYLAKAVQNYTKAAEIEQDPELKQLAMRYLVASYGPDKLNDPSQAEPIVRRMIEMDPNEPENYFYLSRIYEDAGQYEEAEELLMKAREVRPNSPDVYMQLALFYNRQGEFDKTMEALNARAQQEPNNPEAHHTMAIYYWEKAFRDDRIPEAERVKYAESGVQASDRAIELRPDYYEALTYKGLLLRTLANFEKTPARQQELMREAESLSDQVDEIRNRQRAEAGE